MACSDDEADDMAQFVDNFHFVDDSNELITFCNLPICWTGDANPESLEKQIFLQGTADGGLQPIYKPLLKPRKSYEPTIRAVLITLSALHYLKRNPDTLVKPFWDSLRKLFSLYEVKPSENDLIDHIFLQALLQNLKFIVDDDEELDGAYGDEDEDGQEIDLFDSVCSICDNGGELICCEGRCLRSFHATVHDGIESDCRSLGFSKDQVKAIQNFLCRNCKHKQHQCYVCGILGSSDKENLPEVFSCVSALCGYFYHPESEECKQKIFAGESFTCPAHQCSVCKERENKDVYELNFAVCRRCPKAYHRKCLPRRIAYEVSEDAEAVRAWEGLLPNNRILIYCLKHQIESYGTPKRNHIKFPYGERSKIFEQQDLISDKEKTLLKKRSVPSGHSISETTFFKKPKLAEKVFLPTKNSTAKDIHSHKTEKLQSAAPLPLDSETKDRILTLRKRVSETTTLEDVIKTHTVPSTCANSLKHVDKSISQGKVDWFVENNLKVYLAPSLFGMRNTSFGCHFTKLEKLQEIVNKLHPYVQNRDMIVDFCCGANNFSCLMKKKLEETGKKCNFKNFDLISPKNGFNFERRDWMTVCRDELPAGSKLIKKEAYDLIWEDDQKLSGKSFYFPGSVNVDENPIDQWNNITPPLYLWSHPEWTEKHKNIAYEEHHLSPEMPH
ncbi:hypothetical protein MKX01_041531 [Papaver californicum]|nr:hypothetical protein MKX01_041531 [Papaver californicum]